MHSRVISYTCHRDPKKWNQTHHSPKLKRKVVPPEAGLDLQGTPAKNRDLTTWIWGGHRSSPELPSTSNSISTFVIAKSLWRPPVGKRLAYSGKQNRHKLEAQGAHIPAGEMAESTEYRREWQYGVINTKTESVHSGDRGIVSWREGTDPGHWGSDFFWQAAPCDLGWFPLSLSCLNILVEDSVQPSEIPGPSLLFVDFIF